MKCSWWKVCPTVPPAGGTDKWNIEAEAQGEKMSRKSFDRYLQSDNLGLEEVADL